MNQKRFLVFSKKASAILMMGSLMSGMLFATPAKGDRYFDGFSSAAKASKPGMMGDITGKFNSFEIKLATEPDNYRMQGNMRIVEKTGRPGAIYNETYKIRATDPERAAREYLATKSGLFGLSGDDLANLRLHAIRTDAAGTTVRLRQTWMGLQVNKNAEITIHISPAGVIDYVMNSFQYGIEMRDTTALVPAGEARNMITSRFESLANANDIKFESNNLEVLRYQDSDYLVHRINLEMGDAPGDWEALVDARSGQILKLEDVSYYKKDKNRKTGLQSFMVNGTGNVFDPDPLSTAGQTYGTGGLTDAGDADSADLTAQVRSRTLLDITDTGGTFSLVGPYASIVDFESPFKGTFSQASSTFAFTRNADNFEAVNVYYHIDKSMRYINTTLGLTIMPHQYSGGVQFDPSGLSGADNSHYLSGSGRVSFGEGGVDDAEDADVVIHELGHGIHDWVTAGGLSQVNGLSEGSGDYWAGSYSRTIGGWPTSNPAYNWTFNWDGHNPFWDGRIINYGATYPGGLTGQIHTDGQIWATAMMKVYDAIGAEKSDKIFWAGLGLTNGGSNQNDAANAVFTASGNLNYTFAERTAIRNAFVSTGYTIPAVPEPPIPGVNVSGVVMMNGTYGLKGGTVTITDDLTSATKSSSTSAMGHFNFFGIVEGRSYTITVSANKKGLTYTPQTMVVNGNVTGLTFTPVM